MTVTIWHNPACGTSRNTLSMIRASGEESVVIEYLKEPPSRERLKELIAAMSITPRDLLRERSVGAEEVEKHGGCVWLDGRHGGAPKAPAREGAGRDGGGRVTRRTARGRPHHAGRDGQAYC